MFIMLILFMRVMLVLCVCSICSKPPWLNMRFDMVARRYPLEEAVMLLNLRGTFSHWTRPMVFILRVLVSRHPPGIGALLWTVP